MKRNIFYSIVSVLISILVAGCQQLEDKTTNIPIIKTLEADEITDTTAIIYGEIESLNAIYCFYYFLVSDDSSFPEDNSLKFFLEEYEPEESSSFKAELDELMPGTTYYYVMCATDGVAEIRGDVASFTTSTSTSLEIESVFKADGEPYTDDILGVYLANENQQVFADYGNMRALRNGWAGDGQPQRYELPNDFMMTEPTAVYVYTPYNDKNSFESLEVYVGAGDTDYQYGDCTVYKENPKANIEMRSALARLSITLSIDDGFDDDYLEIEYVNLRNVYPEKERLYLGGMLNLADGHIEPELIEGHDGIINNLEWSWKKAKAEVSQLKCM